MMMMMTLLLLFLSWVFNFLLTAIFFFVSFNFNFSSFYWRGKRLRVKFSLFSLSSSLVMYPTFSHDNERGREEMVIHIDAHNDRSHGIIDEENNIMIQHSWPRCVSLPHTHTQG